MHCKLSSALCFNLDKSKILSSGNGLNLMLKGGPSDLGTKILQQEGQNGPEALT